MVIPVVNTIGKNTQMVVNVDAVITGTDIEENVDYRCEILDDGGKVVGKVEKTLQVCGKKRENVQVTVENPSLWELNHPYSYFRKRCSYFVKRKENEPEGWLYPS